MVCGASSSARAASDMNSSIVWRNLGAPLAPHNEKSENDSFLLSERRGDVAAIHRGDIAGGFHLQGLVQEGLGDVVGGYLAMKQVAAHVVLLGEPARLRPFLDEVVGEQPGADAVGVDAV